jgi:hypothetical protein
MLISPRYLGPSQRPRDLRHGVAADMGEEPGLASLVAISPRRNRLSCGGLRESGDMQDEAIDRL